MKRITLTVVLAGLVVGASPMTSPTLEARQFNSNAQFRSRLSDRQVQQILARIRTGTDTLMRAIDPNAPRGRAYGYRAQQGDLTYLIADLAQAAQHLDDHIVRRETTRTDVEDVLRRGLLVDEAIGRQANTSARNTWMSVRRDLDSLSSAYDLGWNWQNPTYRGDRDSGVYARWTGTYAIDRARSDNPVNVADVALRTVSAAERARIQRQIENRLTPPDRLAVDRNGEQVTIASSTGPQLTFTADGEARSEAGGGNRNITTRASMYGDRLEVTTSGANNNSDFAVTFEPLAGGQQLRVTRELFNDALRQPIRVQTTYRRVSDTPDWSIFNTNQQAPGWGSGRPNGNTSTVIPDGTTLTATLDQSVNLRSAREDDRVTLTVKDAPRAEWEGATIEGYVTSLSNRTGDRQSVSVGFDRIRLRNGRTAAFDGDIERIVSPSGRDVTFDGEQTTTSNDRDQAIQRGAIGAAIGAIIGAVAGGGKGAAIGAVLGGGGAAATVFIDGSSTNELTRGTEFTIRSRGR